MDEEQRIQRNIPSFVLYQILLTMDLADVAQKMQSPSIQAKALSPHILDDSDLSIPEMLDSAHAWDRFMTVK